MVFCFTNFIAQKRRKRVKDRETNEERGIAGRKERQKSERREKEREKTEKYREK